MNTSTNILCTISQGNDSWTKCYRVDLKNIKSGTDINDYIWSHFAKHKYGTDTDTYFNIIQASGEFIRYLTGTHYNRESVLQSVIDSGVAYDKRADSDLARSIIESLGIDWWIEFIKQHGAYWYDVIIVYNSFSELANDYIANLGGIQNMDMDLLNRFSFDDLDAYEPEDDFDYESFGKYLYNHGKYYDLNDGTFFKILN